MSRQIFSTYFAGSPAQRTLLKTAHWAKVGTILGVLFQAIMLCFAAIHYHEYMRYAVRYPVNAQGKLNSAIIETIQATVYIYLYFLFYRGAKALYRAASENGTDLDLETAFNLNLRIMKYQCFMIVTTMLYYSYLLWKYAIVLMH